MITVERSVKFNFDDKEVVLPLEGEVRHVELNTRQSISKMSTSEETPISNTPDPTKLQPETLEPLEPTEGRGKCIRKESETLGC